MRPFTIILILLLEQSCSSDKKQIDSVEVALDSATTRDKNDFEIKDEVFFKQYTGVSLGGLPVLVTEQQKVTYDVENGKTGKPILIISKLSSVDRPGSMGISYNLNVKAYASAEKQYDQLAWEMTKEGEVPLGLALMSGYYQTVTVKEEGDDEEAYTLYHIDTGKEFLKFSDIKRSYLQTFFYLSANSVGFKDSGDKTVIGHIYNVYHNIDAKQEDLTSYNVHSKSADVFEIGFTPQISFESKKDLKESGYFRNFTLFQKGDALKSLDTANFYIALKYYVWGGSTTPPASILIPIHEYGIRELEFISNDKKLSEELEIKKQ